MSCTSVVNAEPTLPLNESAAVSITSIINWHTLGAEQNRRVRDYVVAEVYCNNCGNRLGFQFIEVPKNAVFAVEKNLLLHGSKVLVGNANNVALAEDEVNEVDEDESDEDEVDANDN
ncbi:hypothetical protein Vadar_013736 [Vaccinium darrowii]|uniref:Uncharacterized protein n=1 Tax=Vaccinium darrowii TaxID=229202 RepID=A0ACB7X9Z9_9ERIC|nr:hypothetical protein Vadar_013736 [Vaccinium darrowii]